MDNVKVTKEELLEQITKAVKIQRLNELAEYIANFVFEKNQQYGDAWQLYAILTPLIRIREKLVRTENVSMKNGAMIITVKSCEDLLKELMDVIGYSMLAMLWIDANMDISIDKVVELCKHVADAHIEDIGPPPVDAVFNTELLRDGVARSFGIPLELFDKLPKCPFKVELKKPCDMKPVNFPVELISWPNYSRIDGTGNLFIAVPDWNGFINAEVVYEDGSKELLTQELADKLSVLVDKQVRIEFKRIIKHNKAVEERNKKDLAEDGFPK